MLEVVCFSDIKHAYRFTNNLKDNIFNTVSQCYGGTPIADFDENHEPIMKVKIFIEPLRFIEKVAHLGDYIIFDSEEKNVLDILTEDEFIEKYADISI